MEPQTQATWVVAVVAGFLSFISPCVLPLIPGYLSMISGLSAEQLEERRTGQLVRVFFACLLFSAGFGVVFILVGMSAGVVGGWMRSPGLSMLLHMVVGIEVGDVRGFMNVVFGIMVIVFGLFVLNVIKLPFLYQDRRFRLGRANLGLWGAPLLGIAFGFGWTPCVGPWLGTLYTIALEQTPAQAALLFAIYSASLGVCFVAAGMTFAYALKTFAFFQRHYRGVELISGGLLIVIGLLLVTQQWDRATAYLMGLVG